jgi:hypothetical protein
MTRQKTAALGKGAAGFFGQAKIIFIAPSDKISRTGDL